MQFVTNYLHKGSFQANKVQKYGLTPENTGSPIHLGVAEPARIHTPKL
jgi:hypothetical protein